MHCSGAECAERGAATSAPRLRTALAWLALLCAPALADEQLASPAPLDDAVALAEPAPLIGKALLLDIARAGERLVAVGDRGHVVLSDDDGVNWLQAHRVPTRNLLTAVCFADARHGIAVGHDEIALVTEDGGESWKRSHYAPESQQPLLDVWCGADGRAIAVGAYGAYYVSENWGRSWTARRLEARPLATASKALDPDEGLGGDPHLNRIVAVSATRLYIAAEAGHLYRSDDAGTSWAESRSPYAGSFFGLLPLEGEVLLAFGLRGHLFRSEDGGLNWAPIATATTAMLNDAARIGEHGVVIVGLSGTLLESRDGGRSFALQLQSGRKGLSAVMAARPPEVVVAGEDGIRRIALTSGRAP